MQAQAQPEDIRLPPLRQELSLFPGPPGRHGSPTWTIYDPAAYRFYRIGWLEFELISRFALGVGSAVVQAVARETPLSPTLEDVTRVVRFLEETGLVVTDTPQGVAAMVEKKARTRQTLHKWLLKNYLFFRIPLIRPDGLLTAMLPFTRWMFTRAFVWGVVLTALTGAWLIIRQWPFFRQTMLDLMSPEGAIMAACALFGVKVVHEFGHGLATKLYGCRVPTMGVAFMVFYPVLWTDTTEAWKLKERRQRITIVGAGVVAELAVAAVASVLWSILPDGTLRTGAYVPAATAWIMSLAINLNPFMRYDAYYLLSDILETPDLQSRAFGLARHRLREFLFRFREPKPYLEEPGREALLLAYAYGTWIYRFILFLGIALAVYAVFFKVLGVVLMAVELGWFIVLPMAREVLEWRRRVRERRMRRLPLRTVFLVAAILFLLVAPWQRRVGAPAMFVQEFEVRFYAPENARVAELHVVHGQEVKEGDILWRFASPGLEHDMAVTRLQLTELAYRIGLDSLYVEMMRSMRADLREMEQLKAELGGMEESFAELTATAPVDGRVVDIPRHLTPGTWVAEGEPLGSLVGGRAEVVAYVLEADIERIEEGAEGLFYSRDGVAPPVPFRVDRIDPTSVRDLKELQLASLYGGPVGVARDGERLKPERAMYRVICLVQGKGGQPLAALPGKAVIESPGRSLAMAIWRNLVGLVIRESGL